MKTRNPLPGLRAVTFAQLCLLLSAPVALAQTATPVADAATLAKYDANQNGQLDPTEVAAMQADQPTGQEVITMSPFEVVSDTRGYYSANTMSGTRFNTKLEDLASSITVMSKEQMADFAMLDINDVFLYVAGTEGTGTYTDIVIDRNGSIADNVQLNPTQANRVRGIASANVSLGNIETMGRVPVDPLAIDAIEVSRGPNANVFGLGNPSGTLNQVPASANVTRNKAQATFRVDSFEGYRTSLDLNRVLIPNKLAIRGSASFQHDGFVRKPSGIDTNRYNAMIKYQPFKNTTISGSYSYYKMEGNRPNAIPARDNIGYWQRSGRPTWDPVARVIHLGSRTIGPITATNYPGTFNGELVDYFSSQYLGNNHNQMFIDQTGLTYWAAPQGTTSTVGPNGSFQAGYRYLQTTGASGGQGTGVRSNTQPLFATTPTINDKSIYDWSEINLSAPNRIRDQTLTGLVQIDQLFLNTPMHLIAAQASFMREDSERYQRNLIGIANDLGQSGQLSIDINEKRLDGTPNPYFLRPYIGTDKPRTTQNPARWDTVRAQVAYKLDLTQSQSGFLKALGWHQFTAYDEYKYRLNRRVSFRDAIASAHAWIPAGTYVGNQSLVTGTPALVPVTQGLYRYYVGDANGDDIDYAPSDFKYGAYPFVWGNSATGVFRSEPALLAEVASTDSTGGTSNSKQIIKTVGAVMQSHFWKDRLVVTYGIRDDEVYSKFGVNPVLNPDGLSHNYTVINGWTSGDYRFNSGRTTNTQVVLRPFRDMESGTGFFGDFLRGLSVAYNQSESFLPSTPAQDLRFNLLPNPTGEDESWGLGLNLFDGKLVIRALHYDNAQRNARNGDASVFPQRVTRLDLSPAGQTPNPARLLFQADAWIRAFNPTWTNEQVRAEVTRQTGISAELENALVNANPPLAATNDIRSTGNEIEINYNPTKFWTVSASFTETKSINENISPVLADWIAERMPIWTTIKDPRGPDQLANTADDAPILWWNQLYTGASGGQTPAANFTAFVGAPYSIIQQLEGKLNQQVRKYAFRGSTNIQLAGFTDHERLKKMSVGGALRWESKGAIGYMGVQQLPASITDLDASRPIYDKAHYYVDLFVNYKTKLFDDRVPVKFQLNVKNLGESGRLQPVGAFPDGTPHTYRIIDPMQFILQATFDL